MRSVVVIDRETNRAESVAYACLGLASLALIIFAVLTGGKFAAGQDDIVSSLNRPAQTMADRSSQRAPVASSFGSSAGKTGLAAPQQ